MNKDAAKQWFQTGDKPTQAQFYQVFDWLRWNDEKVPITDIDGLSELLQQLGSSSSDQGEKKTYNADGSYNLPAGFLLEKIIVLMGTSSEVRIGTAPGLDDILPDQPMSSDGEVVVLNIYTKAGRTLYFTGLNAGTSIIFFKRIVKSV